MCPTDCHFRIIINTYADNSLVCQYKFFIRNYVRKDFEAGQPVNESGNIKLGATACSSNATKVDKMIDSRWANREVSSEPILIRVIKPHSHLTASTLIVIKKSKIFVLYGYQIKNLH